MPQSDSPILPQSPPKAGCLFQLTALSAGLFLITVLALIATTFGDSGSPKAAWLMRYFGIVVSLEVAAIIVFGFAAMAHDHAQTQRQQSEEQTPPSELEQNFNEDENPERRGLHAS